MLPVFNPSEATLFDNATQQYRDILNCATHEKEAAREITALLAQQLTPGAERMLATYLAQRTSARREAYQQLMAHTRDMASRPHGTYEVKYLVTPASGEALAA